MSFSKKLARFALSGALAMSMVLPNSLAVFQAKVNADSLYLRQSPGGAVITTLSKGTTVAVLNNSSSWYKVSVNGKEGYVSGEYLTGTTATDVALGTGTVKCSSSVNFRSAPNTSSTSYGELKNGTKVNVVGVSSGWYKVTYNGKTGYIHPDYITLASSSTGTAIAPSNTVTSTTGTAGTVKCSSSVNLRSEANTSSSILAELKNGTAVTVVSTANGWCKVTYSGKTGYIKQDYVSTTGTAAVVKCSSTVNFRSAASTSSTILGELKNGTAVTVLSTSNGWSKVSYAGKTGYISADYLVTASSGTAISPSNTAASVSISAKRQSVLNYAAQFLGVPYVYGGSTPSGFDCSGFTSYVFKNTVGSIPRVAQAQYDATTRVSRDDLLPGDLVFFGSSTSSISHVGIYVGSNQFIHAPSTGDVVKYSSLTGSYATRYQGAGRVIFE
ncbi:SH3 domain-containing protein [Butyricicoccus sp. BIOML-A1]|jgi:cell wall-associated NlpC family hydrolase|nr:C40 family peptidase [Butyricicoccus sp. BIOML-A1]MZT26884.1 SH3 domain-containing protein [Butyricicoccus sp. BIOML-A1]